MILYINKLINPKQNWYPHFVTWKNDLAFCCLKIKKGPNVYLTFRIIFVHNLLISTPS